MTGSSASTFHGEPRTTADIDIVIDPDPSTLRSFIDALDPNRFYVGDAVSALARRDAFNVIDVATDGRSTSSCERTDPSVGQSSTAACQ
ncbi:MAG TPA: hypothetical protein VM121_11940 [Acidimicrobiales bacterium]|nr:hypothetical protein [Acidimicrobiales bacterium]